MSDLIMVLEEGQLSPPGHLSWGTLPPRHLTSSAFVILSSLKVMLFSTWSYQPTTWYLRVG